jgi:hypothetical protein
MLRRTAAGAVSALLLVGCGSARESQQTSPGTAAARTVQAEDSAVDQSEPRGCPSESWPGPWAECAEADWVRKVVRHAGYTTGSDTGSALVASTDETSFYIWTTAGTTDTHHDVGERLGTVAETPVYGDGEPWTVGENGLPTAAGWRIWSAQGFIFWTTAGPSAADVPLSFTALQPLIEASKEVLPPPR